MRGAVIAVALAALAAVASGCGAESHAAPAGGDSVVPSTSAAFARVDTELSSPQWQALASLLRTVSPSGGDMLPKLQELKGALGPETDAVALTSRDLEAQRLLGLTQPPSTAKLETLLAKHDPPLVSEEVAGWRVFAADRATIDRFKRARNEGSLAGSSSYQDATDGLPAQALAILYVDGSTLTAALNRRAKTAFGPIPGVGRVSWLAGSLASAPGGVEGRLRLKGDELEPYEYTAALPAQVPAPVVLFVDAKGLDATLDELRRSPALDTGRVGTIVKALGGLLDDVIGLFKGESAFYVRPLPAGPECTLVIQVDDEAAARATLDSLATLAAAYSQSVPAHLVVAGIPVTSLRFEKTTLYYAVTGGRVVITTAPSGVRGLVRQGVRRLTDTPGWQRAAAAAGLPDQTAGIVYADVARAAPLVAKLTGSKPEPAAAHFGPGLAYASVDGSVLSVKGWVGVR